MKLIPRLLHISHGRVAKFGVKQLTRQTIIAAAVESLWNWTWCQLSLINYSHDITYIYRVIVYDEQIELRIRWQESENSKKQIIKISTISHDRVALPVVSVMRSHH